MTTTSPLREAWLCTNCGSAKTEPDPFTPMGQYRTGLCLDEGKNRPLVRQGVTDADALVRRNAERHRLKTLNGQIRRGTVANHAYAPAEGVHLNEAGHRKQPPCVSIKGCNYPKSAHPAESDLRELGWLR